MKSLPQNHRKHVRYFRFMVLPSFLFHMFRDSNAVYPFIGLLFVGETPSNRLEPISDLILALNRKYCEQLSQWLNQLLSQDGFPTARPTKQDKDNFARFILR